MGCCLGTEDLQNNEETIIISNKSNNYNTNGDITIDKRLAKREDEKIDIKKNLISSEARNVCLEGSQESSVGDGKDNGKVEDVASEGAVVSLETKNVCLEGSQESSAGDGKDNGKVEDVASEGAVVSLETKSVCLEGSQESSVGDGKDDGKVEDIATLGDGKALCDSAQMSGAKNTWNCPKCTKSFEKKDGVMTTAIKNHKKKCKQ